MDYRGPARPAFPSLPRGRAHGAHSSFFCMTAFVFGSGTSPIQLRFSMFYLPSTLPGREGGLPHRAAFHQPLETLRVSSDPDFREADQGLSHFPHSCGYVFAFWHLAFQAKVGSSRTSTSHPSTGRAYPVVSESLTLQNATRPLFPALLARTTVSPNGARRQASPAPSDQLQPGTRPLGLALRHYRSLSSVDVWHGDSAGCDSRHCLSICHPQWSISHLPASLRGALLPQSHWSWACLGDPHSG